MCRARFTFVSLIIIATVLVAPLVYSQPKIHAQPSFRIVRLGAVDERIVLAVERAFAATHAYLERLDPSFKFRSPPTIYLCGTVDHFVETLVANGFNRSIAEQAGRSIWEQPFVDGMALNLQIVQPLEPNIPWMIGHGTFRMYQMQRDVGKLEGISFFMKQGTAELFKLKVLEEMGIVKFDRYVSRDLVPQAKGARARYPQFTLSQADPEPGTETLLFWRLVTAAAAQLVDRYGGWGKIVQYFSSEVIPHNTRFERVYGISVADFERKFLQWLDRQPSAGLEVAGGIFNLADGPPVTTLLYAWWGPPDAPGSLIFTLRGPSEWNRGAPRTWVVRRPRGGADQDWALFLEIPAVAGSYTLATDIGGHEVSASFPIALSPLLPMPSAQVTSASRAKVSVRWTAVPNALSYQAVLVDLQGRRLVTRHTTRSTTHTFENLSLSTGPYRVDVYAFPVDMTQPIHPFPPQFNSSRGGVVFDVP